MIKRHCKYCNKIITPDGTSGSWRTPEANRYGYFNVCSTYSNLPFGSHLPMDNLDYLEYKYESNNR